MYTRDDNGNPVETYVQSQGNEKGHKDKNHKHQDRNRSQFPLWLLIVLIVLTAVLAGLAIWKLSANKQKTSKFGFY